MADHANQSAASHPWRESAGLVVLVLAGVWIGAASLLPGTGSDPSPTQWCGILGAGVAAGLVGLRLYRQAGFLTLGMLCLLLSEVAVPQSGSSWARWLSLASVPLVLAFAGLSLTTRFRFEAVVVLGGLLAGPVRMLVYDPFRDLDCPNCLPTATPFGPHLVAASGLALVGGILVTLGLIAGFSRSSNRWLLALTIGASTVSLLSYADVLGANGSAARVAGWLSVTGGLVAIAKVVSSRQRLNRLGAALRSGQGPQAALRELLADAEVTVDFATDDIPARWVTSDGADSRAEESRRTSTIGQADGSPVVRIHYSGDSGELDVLTERITPEIRWGLEQTRLTAVLQAQVRALQASRARVVSYSFEKRRQLERDLHDGAQQHLLALGFDLRRALSALSDDSVDRDALQACLDECALALEELRVLARGISPTLLISAGLRPSLLALDRQLDVPIIIDELPAHRFAPVVEQTVYLLVSEMALAGPLTVRGDVIDGRLSLAVLGGRLPGDSIVVERVEALGGRLSWMQDGVRVSLPCE